MPELAEIHRFCLLINTTAKNVMFRPALIHEPSHAKYTGFPDSYELFAHISGGHGWWFCRLSARVRGKELALTLTRTDSTRPPIELVWNFGLVGRFIASPPNKLPSYALVTWVAHDESVALSYVDMQKMGKWRIGDFDRKRSPDPVLDHAAFVHNIVTGLDKKPHLFKKPIGEFLLNQDYFNGIGNYLRAEVLHRACIAPTTMADTLLGDLRTLAPSYAFENITLISPKSVLLLYLCRAIPLEVLEEGLNKYGTKEELVRFTAWLRVYDKGHFIMSGGRKLYCSKGVRTTPDLPTLTRSPLSTYVGDVYPNDPRLEALDAKAAAPVEHAPQAFSHNPYAIPQTSHTTTQTSVTTRNSSLKPFEVDHLAVFAKANGACIKPNNGVLARLPLSLQPFRTNVESNADLSDTALTLLLVNALHRLSYFRDNEKDTLKVLALTQSPALLAIVAAFFLSGDVDDCVDSCKQICVQGLPSNHALRFPSSTPTVAFPTESSSSHQNLVFSSSPVASSAHRTPASTGTLPPVSSTTSPGAPRGLTDSEWIEALAPEFKKQYFQNILTFVANERMTKQVFPSEEEVFTAFNYTPLSQVKVVILGQDPYFNPGQAHGLCFSVQKGVKVPPSLLRIFKVLEATIPGFKRPKHGYLGGWAKQGVLMLNATLTVESGKANSHEKCGWQTFTDSVIRVLNEKREGVIYFLWGGFAQKKGALVDLTRHTVLTCAHPSPMAGIEFNSCDHFAKANEMLASVGKAPIDWSKCD